MTRYALKNAFVWLCLLTQLLGSTSSAAGLVLCMEDDGSVAIETRLTQLVCCGELADQHAGPHSEPGLVGEDGCVDAPLTLPASLRATSSRSADGVYTPASAVTTIAAPLFSTVPARVELHLPPRVLLPDRTREALSTVVLLV